jgi:hypothetical protein
LSGTGFLAETFQKVFHRLFPSQRQSMGPSCIPGGIIGRGAEILKPVSVPRSGLPFSAEGKISKGQNPRRGEGRAVFWDEGCRWGKKGAREGRKGSPRKTSAATG